MRQFLIEAIILGFIQVFCCLQAWGHAAVMPNSLGQFVPREGTPTAEKVGPCGVARSANLTTLAPGQTVTFNWVEQIKHPGYFIISFSPAGDQNFTPFTGMNMIPEDRNTPAPQVYTTTLTMPMTPCTGCTLQVIQVMQDVVPSTNYYSCADLVIQNGAVPVSSPAPAPVTPPAVVVPANCSH